MSFLNYLGEQKLLFTDTDVDIVFEHAVPCYAKRMRGKGSLMKLNFFVGFLRFVAVSFRVCGGFF